jgi:hypothetical protein
MKDRDLGLDNGWVDTFAYKRLYKHGYSVEGFIDNGVARYVLYRVEPTDFTLIHEFDSAEELNNMIKLLIPPEEE